jgi:hypothetical protein
MYFTLPRVSEKSEIFSQKEDGLYTNLNLRHLDAVPNVPRYNVIIELYANLNLRHSCTIRKC